MAKVRKPNRGRIRAFKESLRIKTLNRKKNYQGTIAKSAKD